MAKSATYLQKFRPLPFNFLLNEIKADLTAMNIEQTFSSEAQMIADGAVEECLKELDEKGLLYRGTLEPPKGKKPEDWEPREQLLFKATQFGDEVDRP